MNVHDTTTEQTPEQTYGEGDATRTEILMRVFRETEADIRLLESGLRGLAGGGVLEQKFLLGLANRAAERITPYIQALSNEYLILQQEQRQHFH